ncbi:MAG: NADH-quinone oxidoreductase subunit N [Bacteriovoracia bacterium]
MILSNSVFFLTPELVILLASIGYVFLSALQKDEQINRTKLFVSSTVLHTVVLFFLILTVSAIKRSSNGTGVFLFSNSYRIDGFTQFIKIISIFASWVASLLIVVSKKNIKAELREFLVLVLFTDIAVFVTASAEHLLVFLIGYQMLALSTLIPAGLQKQALESSESAVKGYFLEFSVAILFCLGILILFVHSDSLFISEIGGLLRSKVMEEGSSSVHRAVLWAGVGLIFIPILLRMGLFPFHFNQPDMLQGGLTSFGFFYQIQALLTGVVAVVRFGFQILGKVNGDSWELLQGLNWTNLLSMLCAVTLFVGIFLAFQQKNLKRLIGAFFLTQSGFLLFGLVVATKQGVSATLLGLLVQVFGILMFILVLQQLFEKHSENIDSLRGLVWNNPFIGVFLIFLILSMIGIPPLVGFSSKMYLLGALIQQKLYWLAALGVLAWVLSMPVFLDVFRVLIDRRGQGTIHLEKEIIAAILFFLVPCIMVGFYWEPMVSFVHSSLAHVAW